MHKVEIELIDGIMPTKGSEYAAAYDVYCPRDFELTSQRNVVPLGFRMRLPLGWKANMRPRSGFSAKGLAVVARTTYRRYNGDVYTTEEDKNIDADVILGLIDCDFRGEVGVIVKVNSMDCVAMQRFEFDTIVENHVYIRVATRLAQMEVCGGGCELVRVDKISDEIDRGGGFGHTGA